MSRLAAPHARLRAFSRLRAHGRAFAADRSGVTIIEFALCLPIFVGLVLVGMESVNFAYANQKVGNIATLTADNIARVRVGISEGDITETLDGIKSTGGNLRFPENGRIIVSSVQPITNAGGTVTDQKIRWQRCTGALNVASSYGTEGTSLGTSGIGPADRKIATAAKSELIFVEVVYTYQPLFATTLTGTRTIRGVAAMNVRERTSNDVTNSGTASSCSTFSAG